MSLREDRRTTYFYDFGNFFPSYVRAVDRGGIVNKILSISVPSAQESCSNCYSNLAHLYRICWILLARSYDRKNQTIQSFTYVLRFMEINKINIYLTNVKNVNVKKEVLIHTCFQLKGFFGFVVTAGKSKQGFFLV